MTDLNRFALMVDVMANFYIQKYAKKYRPRIEIYAKKQHLVYLHKMFKKLLPQVYVEYLPKRDVILIDNHKNVLPLCKLIAPLSIFNKPQVDLLLQFIEHRLSESKKRYDSFDDELYGKMKKLKE